MADILNCAVRGWLKFQTMGYRNYPFAANVRKGAWIIFNATNTNHCLQSIIINLSFIYKKNHSTFIVNIVVLLGVRITGTAHLTWACLFKHQCQPTLLHDLDLFM